MMKPHLKILFLFLIPLFVKAQEDAYTENWNLQQIDSLHNVFNQTANDTARMKAARSLGWHYQEINRDSSLYFHEAELTTAKKLQLKLWQADALDQAGWVLSQMRNHPRSLQYFLEAINILEDPECKKDISYRVNFFKDSDPETTRLTALGFVYNDFSQLYDATGDTEKELYYLFKGLQVGKTIHNNMLLSLVDVNLAATYLDLNKPDSALFFGLQTIKYINKTSFKTYDGLAHMLVGNTYLMERNYTLAKKYLDTSVTINIRDNIKIKLAYSYFALGQLYKAVGKIDSSIFFTKRAMTDSKILGEFAQVNRAYVSLYSLYNSTGNRDSAFLYLQLSKALGDSLNKAEKQKIYEFQTIGFNDQIKMQEQANAQIQKQNTIRTYTLLAGIGVFMLIAFLLYRNNRNRRKANELLQQQKEEIEVQKKNVEGTLAELKSTQSQLIQSEKMASLGELTAGIAHEIQNPLNFVNNFSEVNTELIEELSEEVDKGNLEEVKAIAKVIKENEQKINHHGKRADAIVKGMLQHSQTSTGQKEPTDINKLADEYLRLSYQGLRAKDKLFNATMKTDYDESIGNIVIIPQDIGRVLLNLYNNAFYAMAEKKKKQGVNDESTISISTKKIGDKVELKVADSGNGIPQKIVDKIFQPFFTTKPTGQGTGLGLSLSYDIVKAHGGEIKVDSKEGEGSEFIIQLPIA